MLGRKGDITIRIASLSISNNSFIGEQIMARLDELLAKIETISLGGGVDNSVEIAEIKAAIAANTQAIADNAAGDEITKVAIAENQQLLDSLINKLSPTS